MDVHAGMPADGLQPGRRALFRAVYQRLLELPSEGDGHWNAVVVGFGIAGQACGNAPPDALLALLQALRAAGAAPHPEYAGTVWHHELHRLVRNPSVATDLQALHRAMQAMTSVDPAAAHAVLRAWISGDAALAHELRLTALRGFLEGCAAAGLRREEFSERVRALGWLKAELPREHRHRLGNSLAAWAWGIEHLPLRLAALALAGGLGGNTRPPSVRRDDGKTGRAPSASSSLAPARRVAPERESKGGPQLHAALHPIPGQAPEGEAPQRPQGASTPSGPSTPSLSAPPQPEEVEGAAAPQVAVVPVPGPLVRSPAMYPFPDVMSRHP